MPTPPDDLTLNVSETIARLSHGQWGFKRTTWSKLSTFRKCRLGWFANNFAVLANPIPLTTDDTTSLPGTLIQKLFEVYYNKQLYSRSDLLTPTLAANWFAAQAEALSKLLVMPIEMQDQLPCSHPAHYFRTNEGKARIAAAHATGGLDPVITHVGSPKFLNIAKFQQRWDGHSGVAFKVSVAALSTLTWALATGWSPRHTLAEQFLVTHLSESGENLAGSLDFLYNPKSRTVPFTNLDQLEDGFVIIDGKWRVGGTADPDQPQFYTAQIVLKTKKYPLSAVLFDYQEAKPHNYTPDPTAPQRFTEEARQHSNAARLLLLFIELRVHDPLPLSLTDLPDLHAVPHKNQCPYCFIRARCTAARAAGFDEGAADRAAANSLLVKQTVATETDQTLGITEMTL